MKRYLSLILVLTLAFGLCSCRPDTSDEPDGDDETTLISEIEITSTDGTEQTGETEPSVSESSAETTPAPGYATHGGSGIEGLDAYAGTWVDGNGFVCRIDPGERIFTDPYGMDYLIVGLEDDILSVCQTTDFLYNFSTDYIPVRGILHVEASLSGDGSSLDVLGHSAVRLDSAEGEETAGRMEDLLAGNSFSLGGDSDVMGFNDEMTVMYNAYLEEGEQPISFDGVGIDMGEGHVAYVSIRYDVPVLAYNGSLTPLVPDTGSCFGEWILLDTGTENVTVLTFAEDGAAYSFDPAVEGTETDIDAEAPVLTPVSSYVVLEFEGKTYYGGYFGPGVFGYLDEGEPELLISSESPYASDILSRCILTGASAVSRETQRYDMDFYEGYLSFDLADDQWPGDVADVIAITDYNSEFGIGFDTNTVSSYWMIERTDRDAEIILSFDYDGDAGENTAIYFLADEYGAEPERLETVFENGTAYCTLGMSGIYYLGDTVFSQELTRGNYFDTDPHDTVWGMSDMAGDIPDLVDLDYIRENMDGVFFVSTPEELASVTYYVNTYPDVSEGGTRGISVDIMNDIDLSGYDWAPIGADRPVFGSGNEYSGVFCGNGHTIRNLTIRNGNDRNAFFGYVSTGAVIGLNIEDADISGASASILCYNAQMSEFIDCHGYGSLPDAVTGNNERLLTGSFSSNQFRDCTYDVAYNGGSAAGEADNYEENEDILDLLILTFDPEMDGTYDYSTDYFIDGIGREW